MKLEMVGLTGFEHLKPAEISGGMKKRSADGVGMPMVTVGEGDRSNRWPFQSSSRNGIFALPRMRSTVSESEPSYFSTGSSVRADTATRAPASARRSAMPAPMPRLAPVTSATLPSSSLLLAIDMALLRGGSAT